MENVMRVYRASCLADYARCPQYCYWRWFHDPPLDSKERSSALEIGTLTHECLHLWYKHNLMSLEEKHLLWTHHLSEAPQKGYSTEEIEQVHDLMSCLEREYPTESFTAIKAETTCVVELLEGAGRYIKCTLDGIIQLQTDSPKSPMLVLEHKTSSVARGPIITAYLKSPQIICYTWVAREKLGLPVVGGLFNFLVKTKIPQIVRLPTAVSPVAMRRWLRSALTTIVEIEENLERGREWRQNMGACNTLMGTCKYDPLCKHYCAASLDSFIEAPEDPTREELVIQP